MKEGRSIREQAPEPTPPSGIDAARAALAALSVRAAQGDHIALTDLHRRLHGGLVRWFARTWPLDPERADTLAHETWTIVWQSLRDGRYDPRRAAITTFAFAIAGNLRLRELRRIGKGALHQPSELDDVDLRIDPAESLQRAALLETVRRLLIDPDAGLDDTDRLVLGLLSRGMGDRQIAKELGVSPSTGHERKKQALLRLGSVLRTLGHEVPHDVLDAEVSSVISGGH